MTGSYWVKMGTRGVLLANLESAVKRNGLDYFQNIEDGTAVGAPRIKMA